jgi:hypothetical protein
MAHCCAVGWNFAKEMRAIRGAAHAGNNRTQISTFPHFHPRLTGALLLIHRNCFGAVMRRKISDSRSVT